MTHTEKRVFIGSRKKADFFIFEESMELKDELKLIAEGKHFSRYLNGKIASKIIGIDNGIYILESVSEERGSSNTPVLLTNQTEKPQIYWEI